MCDVICPSCGGRYHETNDWFDWTVPAHGAMFRLKEPYSEWGWSDFPKDDGVAAACLQCPNCESQYTDPQGYIILLDIEDRTTLPRPPDTSEWATMERAFDEYEPELPKPIKPVFHQEKQEEAKGKKQCPHCKNWFSTRGIANHVAKCKQK